MDALAWLDEIITPPPPGTECCARCRRGTKALGTQPCGYPYGCPNPNCQHHRGAKP